MQVAVLVSVEFGVVAVVAGLGRRTRPAANRGLSLSFPPARTQVGGVRCLSVAVGVRLALVGFVVVGVAEEVVLVTAGPVLVFVFRWRALMCQCSSVAGGLKYS